MRTLALLLLAAGPLVLVPGAGATTANDLCPAPNQCAVSDACVVTSNKTITPGSVLDFCNRDLRVKKGVALQLTSGFMEIRARTVTLEEGARLTGPGTAIVVNATGNIEMLKVGSTAAFVDVGGTSAGSISLSAPDGTLLIAGDLRAAGSGVNEASGGDVFLAGRTVNLTGAVNISGKPGGTGGQLEVGAELSITASGSIDGTGGEGGSASFATDAGDITIASPSLLLRAAANEGSGGSLTIDAGRNVNLGCLTCPLRMQGESGGEFGGDGGELSVTALGSITVNLTAMDLSGGPPDGIGGVSEFLAGQDVIFVNTTPLQLQARGSQGQGGEASFEAERDIRLPPINASGGSTVAGGSVSATAWCKVDLFAGRTIDARGGTVSGDILLEAGGQMTVLGRLFATVENRLRYLDLFPITTGAVIQPAAIFQRAPELIPCGGIPPPPPPPGCGDGTLDEGEECDDGNNTPGDGCSAVCKKEECGNGILDPGEQCDDGGTTPGDGCSATCKFEECGNGILDPGETCDDANKNPCDGCSAACRVESCGNEIAECGEECDDGPAGSPACTAQCKAIAPPTCGNGVLDPFEQCDDGNKTACDGCSATCRYEGCGNGILEPQCAEECDDGNVTGGDDCSPVCKVEVCGNGVVDAGEQCDDGNQNECDGCRSDCTVPARPCPLCTSGSTEPCLPCADTGDCDPLHACGDAVCSAGVCTPVNPPNCNDGNRCTTDLCDPARGCVNTPVACGDTTSCDGEQSCDPASGQCVAGPAPVCDDGDECTDDSCSEATPGFACVNQLKPGLDGARCRLAALQRLIVSADLPKATRKRLTKQAKGIARKLPVAAGTGRKATRARKQVSNGLKALARTVAKAQRRLDTETVSELNGAITRTTVAVDNL